MKTETRYLNSMVSCFCLYNFRITAIFSFFMKPIIEIHYYFNLGFADVNLIWFKTYVSGISQNRGKNEKSTIIIIVYSNKDNLKLD